VCRADDFLQGRLIYRSHPREYDDAKQRLSIPKNQYLPQNERYKQLLRCAYLRNKHPEHFTRLSIAICVGSTWMFLHSVVEFPAGRQKTFLHQPPRTTLFAVIKSPHTISIFDYVD
jgi:hypothetical protein